MECGPGIFHFPTRVKAPTSPQYNNGKAVAAAAGGMGSTGQSRVCPAPTPVGRTSLAQPDLLPQGHHVSPIPAAGKPGTGLAVRPGPWQAAAMG